MSLYHVSNPQLVRHELSISELQVLLQTGISSLIDEVRSRMNVGTVSDSLS